MSIFNLLSIPSPPSGIGYNHIGSSTVKPKLGDAGRGVPSAYFRVRRL